MFMEDEIEAVVEGEVKKIGNGGMILSSKKYVGRKVYVLTPIFVKCLYLIIEPWSRYPIKAKSLVA